MTTAPTSTSRRGSALLIVLGLLSFLMISAVAFSISMRTEYAAAASYRRSVVTRELLATAFTDARATVEFAMRNQSRKANFDRDRPETRTVEALAPFKYDNADRYGRLIASYNGSTEDDSIAYLLDDAVMRHIPPYIAGNVYRILEMQAPRGSASDGDIGDGDSYRIDWSAAWKPIEASTPRLDISDQVTGYQDVKAVVGRMAWAVINLSDSLDINAIGSVSKYRGIGLTGNEFAFGSAGEGSSAVDATTIYNLLESSDETGDGSQTDLPLFASNADLAQFAAQVDGSSLVLDHDNRYPYSWEDAIATWGDGFYSPFSVYSFWPSPERKKEDGTRARETNSGTSTSIVISCDEVKESEVKEENLGLSADLSDLANTTLGLGGSAGSIGNNFVCMLADYIDQGSDPVLFNPNANKDIYPHARPTVERVPMISEVSYSEDGWDSKGKFLKDLTEAAEEDGVFAGVEAEDTYESRDAIPPSLEGKTIKLTLPDISQTIGVRAYFPGGAESTGNFTVEPEGIIGVTATAAVGNTKFDFKTAAKAVKLDASGSLTVSGGSTDIFTEQDGITLSGDGIELTLDGENIPVVDLQSGASPKTVTLTFLVDTLFRVKVTEGSNSVDCSPTDIENTLTLWEDGAYPKTAKERVGTSKMAQLDAQFFRITRPIQLTFALEWDIQSSGENNKFSAISKFADGGDPEVKILDSVDFGDIQIASASNGTPSYISASDSSGTWFSVDPRYNWMSPMMGVTGNASAYGLSGSLSGAFRANFSSPHWLFISEERLTTGADTPSQVQEGYATAMANQDIVPFSWGLEVQDIRYGHNDSGQLLLPAEIGFLPVPFETNDWHPNAKSYCVNSIANYHNKVAKVSFFRTIPAVDFEDGATSENQYKYYTDLTTMLKSFAGENFPEEHRGIVHAFAGQDDYYTCQRLRQFAMLGIPSSISQAAKVTYDRLEAASKISRVSPNMTSDDLQDLANLENVTLKAPKYDTFIRDYLFYVPDLSDPNNVTSSDEDSWEAPQELYKGAGSQAVPYRVKTADDIILQRDSTDATFVEKLQAYNEANSSDKLGQNDMTTLLSMARECFGDRQQLFLYILRADSIAYNSSRDLSQHKTLSSARAVALVWRDAYGELPDRVVYYQLLP